MTERTLGVFAKSPRPGQVKTRLAAATSAEWAARVAAALLADTLDRLASVPARRCLVHAPDDAGLELQAFSRDRFALQPQGAGDLGERLARFFTDRLKGGPVVVVGADCPILSFFDLELAFTFLDRVDVVIGPATDGGYYLLGCRRFLPSLFSGIDWGGPHVLRQTVERLPTSASLCMLPPLADVDTLEDWHALTGYLLAERRAGVDLQLPHIEALIREGLP